MANGLKEMGRRSQGETWLTRPKKANEMSHPRRPKSASKSTSPEKFPRSILTKMELCIDTNEDQAWRGEVVKDVERLMLPDQGNVHRTACSRTCQTHLTHRS